MTVNVIYWIGRRILAEYIGKQLLEGGEQKADP